MSEDGNCILHQENKGEEEGPAQPAWGRKAQDGKNGAGWEKWDLSFGCLRKGKESIYKGKIR